MTERWVQIVGTVVTVAGLVVVAPREAGRVPADLWRWVRRAGATLRGWAARVLPFLRRTHSATLAGTMPITSASLTGEVSVRNGLTSTGSHDEQLEQLRQAVVGLRGEIDALDGRTFRRFEGVHKRVTEVEAAHRDFAAKIEEQMRSAAVLNARGFPLAAAGAVLAGIPFAFESWWWTPLFALVLVVSAFGLARARKELAAGWRMGRANQPA